MSRDLTQAIDPKPPEGWEPFSFADGFATRVGPIFMKADAGEGGQVQLGFRVQPYHCNPAGICHGGMMMTVMDIVVGMNTSRAAGTGVFTPSVNMTYDFVKSGQIGDWLESRIEWVHATKRTGFANGYLMNGDEPVMRANGICKIPSADDPRFQMPGGKKFEVK